MITLLHRKRQFGLENDLSVEPEKSVRPTAPEHKRAIAKLWSLYDTQPITRQAFSPAQLPGMSLPHTSLVDVEWGAGQQNDYRFRVFGTSLRKMIGSDLRGNTVYDFPKRSCRTYVSRLFDECAFQAKPVFSAARIEYPNECEMLTQKTFIPLIERDGPKVEKILSIFTFYFDLERADYCADKIEPLSAHERYKVFPDLGALNAAANGGIGGLRSISA